MHDAENTRRDLSAYQGFAADYQHNTTPASPNLVLADRERELLEIKGPCSSKACRLHYAHSGPCDTRNTTPSPTAAVASVPPVARESSEDVDVEYSEAAGRLIGRLLDADLAYMNRRGLPDALAQDIRVHWLRDLVPIIAESVDALTSAPVARMDDQHAVRQLVSPERPVEELSAAGDWGPYDVDTSMAHVPLPAAVSELYAGGLVQPGDPSRLVEGTLLAHLEAACEAVRIGRGSFDQLVLEVLSRAEVGVAMVVIGLIRRAYAAGEAAAIAEMADTPLQIDVVRDIPNELDDSLSEPGRPVYAPCQPIGCDAGFHLAGCVYTETEVLDRG
ncbi:hypothetical protein OWR29_25445 [Actinoplanes sp. Pm04-4]|uniref:Uncharacterized protein n=1 Tax=Paractinoplanes pyxinae TaxID=2997416 RepID=A0ABT4B5P6_9ACTN|nr:hypothetical protein [Actinoplanes pyxinae]MCY1141357.1 hypothetical protein [Actinoplanes pyxinae]